MSFDLLKSETIYPGRAFTVRRDTVRLPNGNKSQLDIVEHAGSVIIIPMDSEGNLLFVRQYRHAVRLDLLELPAGVMNEGETPEVCAQREIREETGMAANYIEHLGGFFLAPGYSTEYMNVFLATELHENPLKADPDEFISVERIPIGKALILATEGRIPDAKSLAALLLAKSTLEKRK